MKSILLDTGFLIRLMNKEDSLHETISECFKYCLDQGYLLLTSTICISEYAVKASPNNLPNAIKVLPFTLSTAIQTGKIYTRHDKGDNRVSVKDDYKIIATAIEQSCKFIITTDAETLTKYANKTNKVTAIAISEDNKFSPQLLNDGIGDKTENPLFNITQKDENI